MDLTQYIDLDSYSSSPGFLGYTDNTPDFSEAGINAPIFVMERGLRTSQKR